MPKSLQEILHRCSKPEKRVIRIIGLKSPENLFVREFDIITSRENYDIRARKTALDWLVKVGILVSEGSGDSLQYKFSETVIQAGGPQWIMKQLVL